ncbi:MAG: polysaccharide biosynthesis/export family protein [Sphingomonadaceae bacterium]
MPESIFAASLVFLLPACAANGSLQELTLSPDQTVYTLGSGDELKITVYGEDLLTGNYTVNGQGKIAFPLLGDVDAQGNSLPELEKSLTSLLADGFVNDPSVVVEVANFRPYYILGEVNKPGEFPFADGLTIYSAVARAGGFTYRADQKRVYIRHKNGQEETLYRLDGATPIQPGDTVRIAERMF